MADPILHANVKYNYLNKALDSVIMDSIITRFYHDVTIE